MIDIGVDIEDINRFKKYSLEDDEFFLKEIYTENELKYCFSFDSPAKHLAGKFCAKEALIKTISNLNIDINMNEIEILNSKEGKPIITEIEKLKNYCFKISISHDKDKAIAVVLRQKNFN